MIAPAPLNAHEPTHRPRPKLGPDLTYSLTFYQTFGWMGVPTLLLALACMCWTIYLIILTVAPNAAANYLMNTEPFDNGTFWLIIDPELRLMVFTVLGFSVVVCVYLYVIATMTVRRNRRLRSNGVRANIALHLLDTRLVRTILSRWRDTTSFDGQERKYWVRIRSVSLSFACSIWLIHGFRIYGSKSQISSLKPSHYTSI